MPNTYNPTPEQRQEQQIMMRVCLARSILARYPNRIARTEFLLNWENRHGRTSREELAEAVRLELLNFHGWASKPAPWWSDLPHLAPAYGLCDGGIML